MVRRKGFAGARRWTGVMVVLALLASACSGNKQAAISRRWADGIAHGLEPTARRVVRAWPTTAPTGPSAATRQPSSGAVAVMPVRGRAVAGTKQKTSSGFSYKAANLFSADQDRVGISSSQITLCMHAALALGPAFHDSPDFQVYWQWLNDNGGIYGRKVNMVFTDDAYTPTGGVQAAQQCYSHNPEPFFMMAGVGFDTVPAVRQWAEQNKMLYLASFATENGLYGSKYTFEPSAVGRALR